MDCDRISTLPDSLLAKILLYLPISDSVKTSVLSCRWGFLWLKVSELDINAIDFLPYSVALAALMKRFIDFNHRSCLQKFKIKYAHYQKYDQRVPIHGFSKSSHDMNTSEDPIDYSKRVMKWIAEVIHRGVQHLDVETETSVIEYLHVEDRMSQPPKDFMPNSMYVSKTLVTLKLVNVGLENPEFVVSLPRLKSVHLEKIQYKGNGFFIIGKLVSGSPVLEDLTLDFPSKRKQEEIEFSPKFSVSMELDQVTLPTSVPYIEKPKEVVFADVPRCLSSTLECVTINKLIMKEETGIKLVNYFLENSAVVKKITLILTHASIRNQEPETYKELLTSTKRSLECQVFVY